MTWCFFGSEVVHGTTEPIDIENSPFKNYDVKYGPHVKPSHNVSIAWGVYNRAPRQEIYDRNVARMARLREEVQQGQRLVSDYFFQRVQNGIRNFEARERNERRQRRRRR